MRLKIILDEGILGRTHKIWVNPPDLYYVSDLTEFLSNYLSLGSTFDLFLQDFFIHPDLLVNEILQDSDELVLKSPEPEKTKIQSFSLQPKKENKKEENFKKDFKKQSKNFKKEMKKNPKILKFSGTVTKFSKNSEENLKNPKISPVRPHDLQVGDQIRFTSLSCTSLKVPFT
jgi:hypothetical protein